MDLYPALRSAALKYVPLDRADELARNLAQEIELDHNACRYENMRLRVDYRVSTFGLQCDAHALTVALWQAGFRALCEVRR